MVDCMIRFSGARPYGTGYMASAQYTTVSGQINIGHTSPMVRNPQLKIFIWLHMCQIKAINDSTFFKIMYGAMYNFLLGFNIRK